MPNDYVSMNNSISTIWGCILWLTAIAAHFYINVSGFLPFQNYLRSQSTKNNYNVVCETLQFLDCICGSTTGGLGLLGLYINENNVVLINQTLESLTEYCQGPCHENQVEYHLVMIILCTCISTWYAGL